MSIIKQMVQLTWYVNREYIIYEDWPVFKTQLLFKHLQYLMHQLCQSVA